MKQRRQQPITSAFPEPNYTQTPNDFFEMLPDMEASEIIVTLIMIRNTFGYHRDSFKMGIGKLEIATGLSRNAVKAGAEAAEKRGTFRRVNPDEQGEAEWALVVGHSVTPVNERPQGGHSVTGKGSTSDPQVGIKEKKESIKETLSPADFKAMTVDQAHNVPELKLYAKATDFFPGSLLWHYVYTFIRENKLTEERIRAAAIEWGLRGYQKENIKGVLEWSRDGVPVDRKKESRPRPTTSKAQTALQLLGE